MSLKTVLNEFFKLLFIITAALSGVLLIYLCITNHKYEYILNGVPISSNLANGVLMICLVCSILVYRRPAEWKTNNRLATFCLSMIFLPFQWLGVHIAAIEYGLREEFNYRFNLFRIVRIWNTDEKLACAISYSGDRGISIPSDVLHEIINSHTSLNAIKQAIINYDFEMKLKAKLEAEYANRGTWEIVTTWVGDHPYLTAAIAVGVTVTVGVLIYYGVQSYQHGIEEKARALKVDEEIEKLQELLKDSRFVELEKEVGKLHDLLQDNKFDQVKKEVGIIYNQLLSQDETGRLEVAHRMEALEKEFRNVKGRVDDASEIATRKIGDSITTINNLLGDVTDRISKLEENLQATQTAVSQQNINPNTFLGGQPSISASIPKPGITRMTELPMNEQMKIKLNAAYVDLDKLKKSVNELKTQLGSGTVTDDQPLIAAVNELKSKAATGITAVSNLRNQIGNSKVIDPKTLDPVTRTYKELTIMDGVNRGLRNEEWYDQLHMKTIGILKSILKFLLLDESMSSEELAKTIDVNNNNSEFYGDLNESKAAVKRKLMGSLKMLLAIWTSLMERQSGGKGSSGGGSDSAT